MTTFAINHGIIYYTKTILVFLSKARVCDFFSHPFFKKII